MAFTVPRVTRAGVLALALTGCADTPSGLTSGEATLVTVLPVPADYGLHDTYVRDGVAFLSAWNTGVIILDVRDPAAPRELARFALPTAGREVTGRAHNAWWFHNPVTGEARYLFVGQEGPGALGVQASGDLFAFDVADLANPRFIGVYALPDAGAHNVWMDEGAQVLFASFYNGGVVALDVSGTLPADLASREIARLAPGGPGNTYTWGVMQGADGRLWAIDMLSGFWALDFAGGTLSVASGGNNVTRRFSSDLWVHGTTGYTGTWGFREVGGNAIHVWDLAGPELVETILIEDVGTVSDVEVSPDGALLLASLEGGRGGFILFDLSADPRHPRFVRRERVDDGLHTATFAEIGGRLYVFAARNPGLEEPALMIWDVTRDPP